MSIKCIKYYITDHLLAYEKGEIFVLTKII